MPFIDPPKLKAARQRAGLSREAAALALGRSYLTVRAYETGAAEPPGNILVRLAALYGVTVEDLCSAEALAGAR